MQKKKLIGYIRVSTKEQGTSGNGLEAQREAIERFARENDCDLVEIVTEVASGKLGLEDRPVLQAAVKKALKMKAYIVVSKLDRLSRSAAFIFNLMNTTLHFVVVQFGFSVDEFMIHIYAVLGEKERKMIGSRTKDALAVLKAQGVALGNPYAEDTVDVEGKLKIGVVTASARGGEATAGRADAFAERMRSTIVMMKNAGLSHSAIARQLNENGTKTARGGAWGTTTVSNLVARLGL